jgi:hypothetical protein
MEDATTLGGIVSTSSLVLKDDILNFQFVGLVNLYFLTFLKKVFQFYEISTIFYFFTPFYISSADYLI